MHGLTGIDAHHRDALVNRADHAAQIAADAMFFVDLEGSCAAFVDQPVDALMGRVFAGDPAAVAVDARCGIDVRDDLVVEVEVVPVDETRNGLAHEFRHRGQAAVVERTRRACS